MTKGQRIGALVLAAIVAVAAFALLRGPGEDPPPAGRQPAAQTDDPGSASRTAGRPQAEPAPSYTTIRIRDGRPVGGVEELALDSGDTARLEFRSDQPTEVHIHGYDKYVDVRPGKPARTRFPANLEGIFEIEDHASATPLAELRVSP